MRIYSPLNINVLLHCHTTSGAYPNPSPAVDEAYDMLLKLNCIEHEGTPGDYRTTDRGDAWVAALCNVECPNAAWVDAQGNILKTRP